MSTAANRIIIEQRENQSKIEADIKLVTRVIGALCVAWVGLTVGLVVINNKHSTLSTKSVDLQQADSVASAAVQGLLTDVQGFEAKAASIITYDPKNCELINTDLQADKSKNVIQTFMDFSSWELCQQRCALNPDCLSWTYVKPNPGKLESRQCHLKNNYGDKITVSGLVSGVRSCKVYELLEAYKKTIDDRKKRISDVGAAITVYQKFLSDYRAMFYLEYKSPLDSPVSSNSSAPTKAPLVCPALNVMYQGTSSRSSRVLDRVPSVLSYMDCSDLCIANPSCTHWTFTSSSRGRGGGGRGECYLIAIYGAVVARTVRGSTSGYRECYETRKSIALKSYPEYHANFVGFGCHAAGCNMGSATNTTSIKNIEFIGECLNQCYYLTRPVYEVTFLSKDYECYCHHLDQTQISTAKHNFFKVNDFEKLKYNLA